MENKQWLGLIEEELTEKSVVGIGVSVSSTSLGRAVATIRYSKCFSAPSIARTSQISTERLREIENGTDGPSADEFLRLSAALGKTAVEVQAVAQQFEIVWRC